MFTTNCFPTTHGLMDLLSIWSIGVLVIGLLIMGYTVFNGMYSDISSEEDHDTIKKTDLELDNQDLTLSKLFSNKK